jgi:hypothetical protein
VKFYRVDPETGEAMDEVYDLRRRLEKEPSNKDVRDRLNALKSQRRMKLLAAAGVTPERRYKRSDLPTTTVVAVVKVYGFRAWHVLCETYPWKVVLRAFERDLDRGYLNCGSTQTPWVDLKGEVLIRSERNKVIC